MRKRVGNAIAQRAAWDQQQRRLLALLVNMAGRIAGFILRREGEVTDIGAVLNLLRLVKRQHVQRGVALHQRFHVVFQQRADNDAGPVLLNLRQHLVKRLGAGVVDFQLCTRVSAGGDHSLRLGCWLLIRLRGLRLRLFCRRGRLCCRRRWGSRLRRWGGNRILHGALRRGLRGGQVAGFGGGRADNVIHIRRLCSLRRNRAAADGGGAVFRGFKTLLNGATKHRCLTV